MRERRWVNPYCVRMPQFEGRIFELDSQESEQIARIRALVRPRCIVELGSGSGNHLVGLGRHSPEASVFGFELRYKRAVRTIEKANTHGVDNVYVIRDKAERISEVFCPRSISALHVNFPDPWAKLKRRKHRILNQSFLDSTYALLASDGIVSIKTDHREYFCSFLETLQADPRFALDGVTHDLYQSDLLEGNIASEFELLFKHKGEPIHHLRFSKRLSENAR